MTSDAIAERLRSSVARPSPLRSVRRSVLVPAPKLTDAKALLEVGKSRDALDLLKSFGELKDLAGTEARLVAGRMARDLGAPRLGRHLHLRAWRAARNSIEAQAAGLNALLDLAGIYAVWRRLRPGEAASVAKSNGGQELLLLRARIAASLRDFESADRWWQKAEQIAPQNPALYVTLAGMLERENRFKEALQAAKRSLDLRPTYAGGIRVAAHLLQVLNRESESLAMLEEGSRRVQNIPLRLELAVLQGALDKQAEADATLQSVLELSPILEKDVRDWVLAFRTRAAWQAGKVSVAMATAREHGTPEALRFVQRLEAGPAPRRVQLPAPFIRQHEDTCAPATICALTGFWGQPADHHSVTEEICYSGTSGHGSRAWAEKHGWITREFTLTWESAKALLDRGIPFALFTLEATTGHAQAVVGYDEARGTLIVRDSNVHSLIEYHAETLLEAQRSSGPAALVLVPADRSSLLDGLALPDSDLRDSLHRFHVELAAHRRAEAAQILVTLQAAAPPHPLTLSAEQALAAYDGNLPLGVRCVERLLELYPGNERLLLQKLAWLRDRDQRDERLALLAEACARPRCSPAFMLHYANELKADARELDRAASWARRALRKDQAELNLGCLAGVLWAKGASAEALELYRFVACLNDKDEIAARSYFGVARHLNQAEAALGFLKERHKRYGHRSSFPAISLCQTLDELGRRPESAQVLSAALKHRPDDGQLRLFAAHMASREGRREEAESHLSAAEGHISSTSLRRARARLAALRKDVKPAIDLWHEILDQEPLAIDAHAELARLIAETEGRLVAIKHLEKACLENPRHFGLHQLLLQWLGDDGPKAVEPVLQRLVELNPSDPVTRCRWARCLAHLGQRPAAFAEADLAVQLDPTYPPAHAIRGWLLKGDGRRAEAEAAYRKAISVAIDYDAATMAGLLDCCETILERRLAVNFLQSQLSRHLIFGDALLSFRALAAQELSPEELLKTLEKTLRDRPDLWHAWAAVIRELAAQGRLPEALEKAEEALARHPLSAELWSETATLHQIGRNLEAETTAREKALALAPGEAGRMRLLANCLDRAGQTERAHAMLEETLRLHPRDPGALLMMAFFHWKQNERDKALVSIKESAGADPDFAPAWETLQSWARTLDQPQLVLETAKSLTEQRRHDSEAWLRLARLHWQAERREEALAAIEEAVARRPASIEAQNFKARIHATEERFTEALEVCRLPIWGATPPPELRATEACILRSQGQNAAAISKLEEVLKEAPHLVWAWERLADWHCREHREDAAKEVMDRLAKALPGNPAPLLWSAAWRHGAGDFPEATDLLEKALRLDPLCVPALTRLMIIQTQTNQFQAIRDTIGQLRQLGVNDWAIAGEACIALRQRDFGFGCTRLMDLCSKPGADAGALDLLARTFVSMRATGVMQKPLEKALAAREPHPRAGELWIDACQANGKLPSVGRLLKIQDRKGAGQDAVLQYLRCIAHRSAEPKLPARLFNHYLRRANLARLKSRLGEWLLADTAAWLDFAAALAGNGQHAQARRWMKAGTHWRQRKGFRFFQVPLFDVLSNLGCDREALEIGPAALRDSAPDRKWWTGLKLAWIEANSGDTKTAAKVLADLEGEELGAAVRPLIRGVIRVREAQPADRKNVAIEVFRDAKANLLRPYLISSAPFVRQKTRESMAVLAAAGAGVKASVWAQVATRRLF